jgi:flagellar capping protein FliD
MRSGLMVENLTSQLGEFFGVKDGKGVLVRSVEKGSRGEKAGFRAGDVVIKVNNQPVRDSSDFTHALRSTSGTAAVTVMRDKREQNLSLTLPEGKDSGNLLEESLDLDIAAETEQAVSRASAEVARAAPAIREALRQHASCWKDAEEQLQEKQQELKEKEEEMREREEERQQEIQEQQQEMQQEIQEQQEIQQKLRHELSRAWAEI